MNIVLTGSLGNIGRPLTEKLVHKGHSVTVISSQPSRTAAIEALGAKAAIGTMQDVDFLTQAFKGADAVYLMETLDRQLFFDPQVDVLASINAIVDNYAQAAERAGVTRIVHLSGMGAHRDSGIGNLSMHHNAEVALGRLPEDIRIKFIRPASFYTNTFGFIRTIKAQKAIIANYGGGAKMPWVAPADVAATIAEEMERPFKGREIIYVASEELSPDEVAAGLSKAIGMPELVWKMVPDQEILQGLLDAGMNASVAKGFVEMQAAQQSGLLYEDYYKVNPKLRPTKFADFAPQFKEAYDNL